jgi:1-aminocyclopropane-1-carboxylate deaminase/D-cysteine desulfhydrase-like pyridoxal-dependent ACC family enzyme
MELIELSHVEYERTFSGIPCSSAPLNLLAPFNSTKSLWIPQGGASKVLASAGCEKLAVEIFDFWNDNGNGRKLAVIVPSGTGTTAALLNHFIKEMEKAKKTSSCIKVVAFNCVGSAKYLNEQMKGLLLDKEEVEGEEDNINDNKNNEDDEEDRNDAFASLPEILRPIDKNQKQVSFGELDEGVLNVWKQLQDIDVNVDLLYGAPTWKVLLQHLSIPRTTNSASGGGGGADDGRRKQLAEHCIMVVNCGGLEGVASQLTRYQRAGFEVES